MRFNDFYKEVLYFAEELGCSEDTVSCFKEDIQECYNDGLSVGDTVDKIF